MINLGLISGILSIGKTVLSGIQNISNGTEGKAITGTLNAVDSSKNFDVDKYSGINTTTNLVLSNNLTTKVNLEGKIENLGKQVSEFAHKKGLFVSYNLDIGCKDGEYFLKDITGRTIGIDKNSEIGKISEQLYKLNKLRDLFDQYPGKPIISLATEIDKTRFFNDHQKLYNI